MYSSVEFVTHSCMSYRWLQRILYICMEFVTRLHAEFVTCLHMWCRWLQSIRCICTSVLWRCSRCCLSPSQLTIRSLLPTVRLYVCVSLYWYMYLCICVCTFMYTCMCNMNSMLCVWCECICIQAYTYVWRMHAYIYVRTYVRTYECFVTMFTVLPVAFTINNAVFVTQCKYVW